MSTNKHGDQKHLLTLWNLPLLVENHDFIMVIIEMSHRHTRHSDFWYRSFIEFQSLHLFLSQSQKIYTTQVMWTQYWKCITCSLFHLLQKFLFKFVYLFINLRNGTQPNMNGINEKLLICLNATAWKRWKVKVSHIREIFRILSLAI